MLWQRNRFLYPINSNIYLQPLITTYKMWRYETWSAPRIAVLLINLGTPDEPTAPAVRRYLRQFYQTHG